jgi:GDP-L-fucose synthase
MDKNSKIYVAGHNGMLGSAIIRHLSENGYGNLVVRKHKECDLTNTTAVNKFFESEKPEIVILAAARVGGIQANINHSAEFLYENLMIQSNVIHQSYIHGVKQFCFLGSSCIYPKECPQPIREDYIMTGPLEPTNEGYALAKISGIKMVDLYRTQYGFPGISLMPCNLYGTNDSFDPENSHVLSSLVKKIIDAVDENRKIISVWGTGVARREFMHVDDAAAGIIYFMQKESPPTFCNLGWGIDISIKELVSKIAIHAKFFGDIEWDNTKPDGMLRKCMDVSRMIEGGFSPKIDLDEGIKGMITEYREKKNLRR